MAVPALVLMRAAQSALRQWRALPDEERERLADAAGAVRRLGFEMAGDKAPSFLGPGPGVTQQPGARREREEVARELRDAVAVLATSAGSSAVAAKGSSRSGAIAGRLAVAGARRLRLGEGTGPRQRASRRPDHGRRSSSSSSARSARRGSPRRW